MKKREFQEFQFIIWKIFSYVLSRAPITLRKLLFITVKFFLAPFVYICKLSVTIFVTFRSGALGNGDYLITIPRVFRAGTKVNVGINIFGDESCDVEIRLYGSATYVVRSRNSGHFQPNEAGTLGLQVSLHAIDQHLT